MGKIRFLLVFFGAALIAAAADDVTKGMTEADLLEFKGKPSTKATLGDKTMYRWPDMEVTLREGRVVAFKVRDLDAERREEERRQKAVEEAKAKEAEWLAWKAAHPTPPSDQPQTSPMPKTELQIANERLARVQRMVYLRDEIAALNKQIDRASEHFVTPTAGSGTQSLVDLDRATIAKLEAELAELERKQD